MSGALVHLRWTPLLLCPRTVPGSASTQAVHRLQSLHWFSPTAYSTPGIQDNTNFPGLPISFCSWRHVLAGRGPAFGEVFILQSSASQALMHLWVTWGSCSNYFLIQWAWDLRLCISDQLKLDATRNMNHILRPGLKLAVLDKMLSLFAPSNSHYCKIFRRFSVSLLPLE